MENTIIAREHSFTNKGLKTATNRIIKATEQTAKSLMTIALTMVEIEEKELYKDDFSSVVEYGEKVFGYKKSAVYNMLPILKSPFSQTRTVQTLRLTNSPDSSLSPL